MTLQLMFISLRAADSGHSLFNVLPELSSDINSNRVHIRVTQLAHICAALVGLLWTQYVNDNGFIIDMTNRFVNTKL